VGNGPYSIAANTVTNKIYVSYVGDAIVTVIDGDTNQTTDVNIAFAAQQIAVNPVTNKIYASQQDMITVIDGITLITQQIKVLGSSEGALAVDSNANKIYVVNRAYNQVDVVDGLTFSVTPVAVGYSPFAITTNPVTGKIYVGNQCGNDPNCFSQIGTVTVIDGHTLTTQTVDVGDHPYFLAVNSITNKTYVANDLLGIGTTVTVIDGSTLSTDTVSVGLGPWAIGINSTTNKIYVSDSSDRSVTMIDGVTNNTVTVPVGNGPQPVVVNDQTDRIYVANFIDNSVSVIAGPSVALSISKTGSGSVASVDRHINCGNVCSFTYNPADQVTLSAVPAPGYTFNAWTGCDNVNGSFCELRMTQAKNVTAAFIPATVTLTSLTFKPSYVRGGQLSAGTLTLNSAAPPGGVTIALTSDHPGVAHPPSFVFVPGGKTSAQFAVNTFPVKSNTTVTLTATAGSSHVSGTLTVGTTALAPALR
jgi:DNA-binding beta-propeller fold protein YncE